LNETQDNFIPNKLLNIGEWPEELDTLVASPQHYQRPGWVHQLAENLSTPGTHWPAGSKRYTLYVMLFCESAHFK